MLEIIGKFKTDKLNKSTVEIPKQPIKLIMFTD